MGSNMYVAVEVTAVAGIVATAVDGLFAIELKDLVRCSESRQNGLWTPPKQHVLVELDYSV